LARYTYFDMHQAIAAAMVAATADFGPGIVGD
jgi:UDP-galactopyranose mutase